MTQLRAPASAAEFAIAQAVLNARRRRELRAQVDQWEDERDDLASFIPVVYKTDTGQPAHPPAHLKRIIEILQDDGLGDTLIIAPPGSIKTNTLIAAAGWWLGRDPTEHIGFFSNTDRQAYRRSVSVRDTIARNPSYAAIFPNAVPDYRKGWAEFEWFLQRPDVNDKDASLMAAGVGSAIQGSRLKRITLDDIADKKNMATALQRAKVIEWLTDQVMTRRGPGSRAVMICTRWHPEDPAAWAMKQGWRVIRIQAINADGESYWPERWPVNKLACSNDEHGQADPEWEPTDEQRQPPCWVERDERGHIVGQGNCWKFMLGSRSFNLVYQGETTDDASAIFKRSLWRRYKDLVGVSKALAGIFIDLAHEEKKEADFTVAGVWYNQPPNLYLRDVFKYKLEFPEVLELCLWLVSRPLAMPSLTVQSILRAHGVDVRLRDYQPPFEHYPIYIEETPGSKPLIQTLRRQVPGVLPWSIEGRSKLARANASVPFVESGNVWLPADDRANPWVQDFIEELAGFPMSEHDDQVDMATMAILRYTRGGTLQTW